MQRCNGYAGGYGSIRGLFLVFLGMMGVGACSSLPRHSIHQLLPDTLHVRRPSGPPADPQSGPGGVDYQSHPLPNERFNCEPAIHLFQDWKLNEIKKCLLSIQDSTSVFYQLIRDSVPYLKLEDYPTLPPCVREQLLTIPVPREIVFLSSEEGAIQCYSSRLNIEKDQWMGAQVPREKYFLEIHFPLSKQPKTQADLLRLLVGWAITPFWQGPREELEVQFVPEGSCRRCLGSQTWEEWNLLRAAPSAPPVLWPSD